MRLSSTLRLPIGILFLCLSVGTGVEARNQQCRLKPRGGQVVLNPPTNTSAIPTSTSGTTSSPTATPFDYATGKIRGVNLGGWFVLEPWITPSVFESTGNDNIVDEFTLGQLLDQQTAMTILENHWDAWITEDDFIAIKAAGLTHVRLPIGYWSIPITSSDTSTSTSSAPYITGAWSYILRALRWAQKHSIHVILDLHGAPGSQNGYDNSGQRTSSPVWALNPANMTRTVDTLRYLATNVGGMVDVIELLNEPAGFMGDNWASAIRQFWSDGYDAVRAAAGQDIKIMIGDAFLGVQSWEGFLTAPNGQGVFIDFHEYQIFSDPELDRSFDDHINYACTYVQSLGNFAASNIRTVVGEWSNAVTDCALWLNGRGVGARWDNTRFPGPTTEYHGSCANYTGSYAGFSDDYKTFLRKYWEVQVYIGENVQGWIFWTWKAENADEWSYQKGLEGGWIPMDPSSRLYPDICS